MPNQYSLISALNYGEWSAKLLGQVEEQGYKDACQVLENFLICPHGPAFVRPGFKFIAQTKDPSVTARLIPFIFSNLESYMMEWGNEYIRFFSGPPYSWILDPDTGLPLEVSTPYQTADLPYIQTAESFDVVYCVNPLHPVYKLQRFSQTSWSFPAVSFNDGPYMDQNDDSTLFMQVSATGSSGSQIVQPQAVLNVVNYQALSGPNQQAVQVIIINGGSGLTAPVTAYSSGGSGLTFTPIIVNGSVTKVTQTGTPTGYKTGDTLTFVSAGGSASAYESVTLTASYRGPKTYTGTWTDVVTASQPAFTADLPSMGFMFTPADGCEVNSAQLYVTAAPPTATPVIAYVYSNASGSPGTVIDTSSLVDINKHGNTVYTFEFTTPVALSPGTAYWIVFTCLAPVDGITLGCVNQDLSYGSGAGSTPGAIINNMSVDWRCQLGITPTGPGVVFYPGHVGALWRLKHGGQTVAQDFTSVGQATAPLRLRGKFQVDTTPDTPPDGGSYWIGTIVLQSSTDLNYWEDVATFFYSTTQSFVESRSNIYYRLFCTQYSSGSGNTGQISQAEQWGTLVITQYISPSQVTGSVLFPFNSTDPTPSWREGAWSDYRGYPATALFHDDRLWFGMGDTIWGSWVGDFENFNPDGDTDDAAITFSPTQLIDPIVWMESQRGIMIGSIGEEGQITGGSGSNQTPITATSILCNIQTSHGSAQYPAPVSIGQATLFTQVARRKIREFVYDLASDGFKAPDLTIRAEHITVGGIFGMCYQQEPYSIVYCVRGDGVLLALTYQRDEKVVAWSRITTQGTFESCASKMASNGITVGYDELWCIVNRTINGQTVRCVELMANNEPLSTATRVASDFCLLDCATVFSSGSATLTGLDYLDGMTATAIVDGLPEDQQYVVSNGSITVSRVPQVSAVVGLPYQGSIQTFPLEPVDRQGPSLGRQKLSFNLAVRMLNSLGGQYGASFTDLYDITYSDLMADTQRPLFNGVKRLPFNSNTDELSICFRSTPGLPMEISAVSVELSLES